MNTFNTKTLISLSFLGCAFALPLLPSQAAAQAMSPMRGEVKSFSDSFALKVYPANPYEHRIRIEVKVYDQDFNPVEAQVSRAASLARSRVPSASCQNTAQAANAISASSRPHESSTPCRLQNSVCQSRPVSPLTRKCGLSSVSRSL